MDSAKLAKLKAQRDRMQKTVAELVADHPELQPAFLEALRRVAQLAEELLERGGQPAAVLMALALQYNVLSVACAETLLEKDGFDPELLSRLTTATAGNA